MKQDSFCVYVHWIISGFVYCEDISNAERDLSLKRAPLWMW